MVLPRTHGSECAEFAGVCQAAMLQRADDFRLSAAQKGVGRFFQRDRGGQGDLVCRTQLPGGCDALFQGGVIRFAGQSEAQVGGGIFVGAIHPGGIWEPGQALQGMEQLFRSAFEVPAAACSEQHVAAEQYSRRDKRNMVVDVSGNFDDVELDSESIQLESVALAQVIGDMRIIRMSPPVHRHVVYFAQFCDTADVVGVAMSTQDGIQLQAAFTQEGQHGLGFAGIHHHSSMVAVDGPDIVVLQGGNSGDLKDGVGSH